MRKSALAVLTLLGVLLIVGGMAAASIPDAGGVIHGCRKTSDGSLRVIDTAVTNTCPNGFVPLNWRQGAGPTVVSTVVLQFEAGGVNGTGVGCPAGTFASGGGAIPDGPIGPDLELVGTWPIMSSGQSTGWQAIWRNVGSVSVSPSVSIFAICA